MKKAEMKHVVLLEDNPNQILPYVSELEVRGYEVSVASTIEQFMDLLVGPKPIDLFILDVMITGPDSLSPALPHIHLGHGNKTGLIISKVLRHSGIEIPIILFSVAWLEPLVNEIKKVEKDTENIAYLNKTDTSPEEFGAFVKKLFEDGKIKKGFFSYLSIFGEALLLKPSFCGLGVDIKKLLKWA